MEKGQRVEIIDGVLIGEKATIVANPENGKFYDNKHRCVWVRFDRDGAHLGREKGYAILSQQWYEIERLRAI